MSMARLTRTSGVQGWCPETVGGGAEALVGPVPPPVLCFPFYLTNSYWSFHAEATGHFLQEAFPDFPVSLSKLPAAGCPRCLFPGLCPQLAQEFLRARGRPGSWQSLFPPGWRGAHTCHRHGELQGRWRAQARAQPDPRAGVSGSCGPSHLPSRGATHHWDYQGVSG